MPADEVEPTLSFKDELQATLLTQFLTELLFRQSAQFEGRTIGGCVLNVQIRTPIGTTANLVDGVVSSLRRTVEFVLSLSLDEQNLSITDHRGVGALTSRITCRGRIGVVQRVDILAETRNCEHEVCTRIRIEDALCPRPVTTLVLAVAFFVITVTGGQQHRLGITPVGGKGAMAGDVAVHRTVVLDGEDVLRAVFLIHRPVVDKLVEQTVLAGVNHLLGIVDSLLIVGTLVGLSLLATGLGPGEIDFG